MDEKTLNRALELKELIKVTSTSVNRLDEWIKCSKESNGNSVVDKNYSLCISEHRDGSGKSSLELFRYFGNTEILLAIQVILKRQLEDFHKEFASL